MSGFEITGVVLGVLPLLISAVGTYDNVYRPFVTRYKDYEPALKSFQQGLLTERAIFRNECRLLLRSSVDSERVQDMLEDLKHDGWADSDIEQKVSQYLGDSKEECKAAIARIRGKLLAILKEYQRYGIMMDLELLNTDLSHMDRTYWKLKFCWSEGRLDLQLQGLSMLNQSFHTLSEQVIRLTSYETKLSRTGDVERKIKGYGMIQKVSIQLCKALETACINHPEHLAHVGLDIDYLSLSEESRIKFELAFKSTAIGSSQHPVWLGIDSEFGRDSNENKVRPPDRSDSQIKPANPICSHQFPGMSHEHRISYRFFPWRGHFQPAVDPTSFPSKSPNQSCPSPVSKSETITPEPRLLNLNIHQNLCEHVSLHSQEDISCGRDRRLIGCLDSDKSFRHFVYLIPPPPISGSGMTFSLSELISSDINIFNTKDLSRYDKLRLARQLAAAVLQFHSTPLLGPVWRSEDIIFFCSDSDTPKQRFKLPRPHLRVQFRDRDRSVHAYPTNETRQEESDDEDEDEDGIRNQYFYRLAIIFIELAHLAPINELYEKHGEANWVNCRRTEYKLAQRLSKTLSTDFGPTFGKVIRRCLACDFGRGTNLTDPELRIAFHRDVVSELERLETLLGKLYCV